MKIRIKDYIEDRQLTIYKLAKTSKYGYTTIHKSYNKVQTDASPLNLRDLQVIAEYQKRQMWEVLKELENGYMEK